MSTCSIGLAMPRLDGGILVRLFPVDAHAPDALDLEPEWLAGVVDVLRRDQHDAEERQEREEDLDGEQKVLPLAVPDQPHQVTGHRGPPLSACTGFSRDIRHAG